MKLLKPLAVFCTFEGDRYRVYDWTTADVDGTYATLKSLPDNACLDYVDDSPVLTPTQFEKWLCS